MNMKKMLILLSATLFYTIGYSQTIQGKGSISTGVADLDQDLNQMNQTATGDIAAFTNTLATRYNVPVAEVQNTMNRGLEPAETYLAYEVSSITRKPVDEVVTTYQQNKEKGWGVVAMQLGIKPGSKEFHALKENTKTVNKNQKEKQNGANGNDKEKQKGKPEDKKDSGDKGKGDKGDKDNKGSANTNGNSNGRGKGNNNSQGKGNKH